VKCDLKNLVVLHYPDPRLRARCAPVTRFDDKLATLAERMLKLMHEFNGVGLAAPQVGVLQRFFVMQLADPGEVARVFVNPVLRDRAGNVEAEEGCLCLPGVDVRIRRAKRCRIEAQDLKGHPFELEAEDLAGRIWQHEVDHLDGVLIIDRMGPADRIATRKTLRALEGTYAAARR
jgi:peptide deformylase